MGDGAKSGIKALFARLDANGDGFLDRDELKSVFGKVGAGHLSSDDLDKLIDNADKTEDGKLAYPEFLDWLFATEVRGERSYLERYCLQEFANQLMQRLKEEEPEDPYTLICEEAAAWRVQWKEVKRKSKRSSGKDLSSLQPDLAKSFTSDERDKKAALDAFVESIGELLQRSEEIKREVVDDLYQNESPWEQDIFYRGAGLEDLLDDAKLVKPVFDKLCEDIVNRVKEKELLGPNMYYNGAPIKGYARAEAKTRVSYLNDASMLTDVVRGTIVLDLPPNEALENPLETLGKVYDILELVRTVFFDAPGARVTHFDDRYQRPLGNYRDFLFLVKVHGFMCELQLNFDVAIKLKEGQQHKEFEVKRMANDLLLEATMTNNMEKLTHAIEEGATAGVCDKVNRLSALHYAAASGQVKMTRCLLENNADPLAIDCRGRIALNRPVHKNFVEVSQLLLEYMTSEDQLHRYSSLHDSAQMALLITAERAKKNGMTEQAKMIDDLLNLVFSSRGLKVFFAVRGGAMSTVKLIIEELEQGPNAEQNIQKALNGWFMYHSDIPNGDVTVLDEAVLSGFKSTARYLASKGAQFHPQGPHKNPQKAAQYYAEWDQAERLHALLYVEDQAPRHLDIFQDQEWGAKNEEGECMGGAWGEVEGTPLDYDALVAAAVEEQAFKSLAVLLDDGHKMIEGNVEGGLALIAAAGKGDEHAVRLLLNAGASINSLDKKNRTALWVAVAGGHAPTAQILCDANADPNVIDCWGKSPLAIAAINLQLDCVQVLCDAGADLSISAFPRDRKSHPATICAANGAVLILKAMHNAGMDLKLPVDDDGWTVAHSAARHSQEAVLRFLYDSGVLMSLILSDASILLEARNSKTVLVRPGAVKFLEEHNEKGKDFEY